MPVCVDRSLFWRDHQIILFADSDAAIVCYSPLEPKSWSDAIKTLEKVRAVHPGVQAYIAATKLDLMGGIMWSHLVKYGKNVTFFLGDKRNRPMDYEDTRIYTEKHKCGLHETSAKTGEGINELFLEVAADFLERFDAGLGDRSVRAGSEKRSSSCQIL